MAAVRFRAYADAAPALAGLRERGLACLCVSNWDISLQDVLRRCGLRGLLDGVVISAAAGASKPDPAIFARCLALAGCAPARRCTSATRPPRTSPARVAAGIPYLLLDRDATAAGEHRIASLTEIDQHLRT